MIIDWNGVPSILLAPDPAPEAGAGGGGNPPPAAPAAALAGAEGEPPPIPAPPAPPPAAPETPPAPISLTSEQFNERLTRDRAAQLKRMGFDSEEELTAMRDRDKAATEAAETARREQQTKEQQLQEDVTARTAERDTALLEAEGLRWDRHVNGICATLGIRNVSYASHVVEEALEAAGEDGPEFDVEEWLKERLDPEKAEHTATRAAFGMLSPVTTEGAPATTTSVGNGDDPPTPPPGGGPPSEGDVMNMTAQQFQAHLETKGMG